MILAEYRGKLNSCEQSEPALRTAFTRAMELSAQIGWVAGLRILVSSKLIWNCASIVIGVLEQVLNIVSTVVEHQ